MQATRHHLHNFYVPTHFSHHIFSKKCFSPQWGAHFRKTTSSTFDHFFHFFPPKTASKRAFFPVVFALFALLAVPIPIFSLFETFGIFIFAHHLCIFSLRSPVSKNDRMHHTYIFVNFVAIDASLHQTYKLQDIFFIFLMLQLTFRLTCFQKYASRCCGKHIFAKRFLALPIKHITFLPPKRPEKGSFLPFLLALVALLAVQIAISPLLELFKKGMWPESRAHFASKAPSATTIACITPANL